MTASCRLRRHDDQLTQELAPPLQSRNNSLFAEPECAANCLRRFSQYLRTPDDFALVCGESFNQGRQESTYDKVQLGLIERAE